MALDAHERPVIAFSGGKDSLVVLHLVRALKPDCEAMFCNTGVEYPETVRYCKTIPNLDWVQPTMTFWECVDKWGWPVMKGKNKSTRQNECCLHLKELPAKKYYKENKIHSLPHP